MQVIATLTSTKVEDRVRIDSLGLFEVQTRNLDDPEGWYTVARRDTREQAITLLRRREDLRPHKEKYPMKLVPATIYDRFSAPDLDGCTLAEAIKALQECADLSKPGARLDWCQRDYEEGYHYTVIVPRLETAEELAKRQARADEHQAELRRTYETLKRQFGDA